MAEIKGIKLTGIQTHAGVENNTLFANVYMDGKKVGTISDDGWGGGMDLKLPGEVLEEIKRRHAAYIREKKIEDYLATYRLTEEQYLEASAKGNIPLMGADPEEFFYTLAGLHELEKSFKRAVKSGWKELVIVEFVPLAGPQPLDQEFKTKGGEKAIEMIRAQVEKQSKAYRLTRYRSLDDFKIA